MKVLWLLSDRYVSTETVHLSHLASSRYRCANFLPLPDAEVTVQPLSNHLGNYSDYDAVVIGKFFNGKIPALAGLISKQTRLLLDCCDISKSVNSGAFAAAAKHAHHVVSGSHFIKDFLHRQHGIESTVIPDCINSPIVPYVPTNTLNLLWFGHGANIAPLIAEMPAITRSYPGKLRIVSNTTVKDADCRPWSINEVKESLAWADVALLPKGDSVYYQAKGLNRYYEAIAAAVWPAGTPLAKGIDFFLGKRKPAVPAIIAHEQDDLRKLYTPEPIANQWSTALNHCVST